MHPDQQKFEDENFKGGKVTMKSAKFISFKNYCTYQTSNILYNGKFLQGKF